MRKFAVAVDGLTEAEQTDFLSFCKENNLGWWHWIDNFWLLADPSEELSVQGIRDQIGAITGGKICVVLAVREAGSWAGTASSGQGSKMFSWLRQNWFNSEKK